MGSGTPLQNSMGSLEPMEPVLTQPLLIIPQYISEMTIFLYQFVTVIHNILKVQVLKKMKLC